MSKLWTFTFFCFPFFVRLSIPQIDKGYTRNWKLQKLKTSLGLRNTGEGKQMPWQRDTDKIYDMHRRVIREVETRGEKTLS